MGGGEIVKKGYLIKSPPLDGKMKVRFVLFCCVDMYASFKFVFFLLRLFDSQPRSMHDVNASMFGVQALKVL